MCIKQARVSMSLATAHSTQLSISTYILVVTLTVSAGLIGNANTVRSDASAMTHAGISRSQHGRYALCSTTPPMPYQATTGNRIASTPAAAGSGSIRKSATVSAKPTQSIQGDTAALSEPDFPPGFNPAVRLHDMTEFPGLTLGTGSAAVPQSQASSSLPQLQPPLTPQLQHNPNRPNKALSDVMLSGSLGEAARADNADSLLLQGRCKPVSLADSIEPPPGFPQLGSTTEPVSHVAPSVGQTATMTASPVQTSVSECSFHADALKPNDSTPACTPSAEVQLQPGLSQDATGYLVMLLPPEVRLSTQPSAAAQLPPGLLQVPAAPTQTRSGLGQAATATAECQHPPGLTQALTAPTPDPTGTVGSQSEVHPSTARVIVSQHGCGQVPACSVGYGPLCELSEAPRTTLEAVVPLDMPCQALLQADTCHVLAQKKQKNSAGWTAAGRRQPVFATDRQPDRPGHLGTSKHALGHPGVPDQHPSHNTHLHQLEGCHPHQQHNMPSTCHSQQHSTRSAQPRAVAKEQEQTMHHELEQPELTLKQRSQQRPSACQRPVHSLQDKQPGLAATSKPGRQQASHSRAGTQHQKERGAPAPAYLTFSQILRHTSADDHQAPYRENPSLGGDPGRLIDPHSQHLHEGPAASHQSALSAISSTDRGRLLTLNKSKRADSTSDASYTGGMPKPGHTLAASFHQPEAPEHAGNGFYI